MLQAIRERAQGIFAWVLLLLIAIPFALWGIQNYFQGGQESPVAEIGSHKIYERDVNRAFQQRFSQFLGFGGDEAALKRQALDQLIVEQLLRERAEQRRLAVSDDTVRQQVYGIAAFHTDGRFDRARFDAVMQAQNIRPTEFYAQIRATRVLQQLEQSIRDSGFVTDAELEQFLRLREQTRSLRYVRVPYQASTVELKGDELRNFYDTQRALFEEPEQVTIEYLSLSADELANTIRVSEEELRAFYEQRKDQYRAQERRRLRHILFAAEGEEALAKARARAAEAAARLAQGADFAELARQLSDDSASAGAGGDLGWIVQGVLEPAFEKAAFGQAAGTVSEPVQTSFGIHLIRVDEIQQSAIQPFEAVRAELEQEFRRNAAESHYYEKAERLAELAFEQSGSLRPAAEELGLKIQRSQPFTRSAGEGIAEHEQVREAAFSDDGLQGLNSEPIEVGDLQVVVLRVVDHREATVKPYEAVQAEVEKRLRAQRGREETRARAEAIRQRYQEGMELAQAVQDGGLHVQEATVRRNGTELPSELAQAVFKAAVDPKRALVVPALNGDHYVVVVTERKQGDIATVEAKLRDETRQFLEQGLSQLDLATAEDEMRRLAKVKVRSPAESTEEVGEGSATGR